MWNPVLADLPWVDVQSSLEENDVVVVPVGSLEQHGPHLPLRTDAMNVEYVAIESARRARAMVSPTIQFGYSENHMGFAGTISIQPQTLILLVHDVVISLIHHGFRRVILLNGHGGNWGSLLVVADNLRQVCAGARIGVSDLLGLYRPVTGSSSFEYHADEVETSTSMVVAPELVNISRAIREVSPAFERYYRNYYEAGGRLAGKVSYGLPDTRLVSDSGVMGDAMVARESLGRLVLDGMIDALVSVIQDIRGEGLH